MVFNVLTFAKDYWFYGVLIIVIIVFVILNLKKKKKRFQEDYQFQDLQPVYPRNLVLPEKDVFDELREQNEDPELIEAKKEMDRLQERLRKKSGEIKRAPERMIPGPRISPSEDLYHRRNLPSKELLKEVKEDKKKKKFSWYWILILLAILVFVGAFVWGIKYDKFKPLTNLVCQGSNLSCPNPAPCPACNPAPCPTPEINIINNATTKCIWSNSS